MTRDEGMAIYRPIRASIRTVLRLAAPRCTRADLQRAAKHMGLWQNDRILVPEGTQALDMLYDIALFEPNRSGRRVFDRFVEEQALQFAAPEVALAFAMKDALFSLFRVIGPHETLGIWVENLLDDDRRLWLVDENLEASASEGIVFGTRLFDAGRFHAALGILAPADEETITISVDGIKRHGRLPFRHSLAATLYGDILRADLPLPPEVGQILASMLGHVGESTEETHELPPPASRRARPRKRE